MDWGITLVAGAVDTPLMMAGLGAGGIPGAAASNSLERAGLTCNKNLASDDLQSPTVTSHLRVGVTAGTMRGFGVAEFEAIRGFTADVLHVLAGKAGNLPEAEERPWVDVHEICQSLFYLPRLRPAR